MTRNCHNHNFQANRRHNEKETLNTNSHDTQKVNQLALPLIHSKLIAKLEAKILTLAEKALMMERLAGN